MGPRQLWIFSLVLCSAAPDWKLTAPDSLKALQGSCVVIPCTFYYGNCSGLSTPEKGMWSKDNNVKVFDTDLSKIDSAFKNRTELLGEVKNRTCTLKISNLTEGDSAQYTFRVEGSSVGDPKICHYGYIKNPVKLTVGSIDIQPVISMDEVEVGSSAVVNCSVNYTCLSDPPDLHWSHEKRGKKFLDQNQNGESWTLTSTLTFLTQDSDLDHMINCTAKYKSPLLSAKESILLKLGHPPRIKEESACKDLQCRCVVESRPPSIVKWVLPNGKTVTDRNDSVHTLDLSAEDVGVVFCTASNRYGNVTMSFSQGSFPVLYIVIPAFAVIFILAVILALWRCRNKMNRKNSCSGEMTNQLYRTESRTAAACRSRRPIPPVQEMFMQEEQATDDDYICPVPLERQCSSEDSPIYSNYNSDDIYANC